MSIENNKINVKIVADTTQLERALHLAQALTDLAAERALADRLAETGRAYMGSGHRSAQYTRSGGRAQSFYAALAAYDEARKEQAG